MACCLLKPRHNQTAVIVNAQPVLHNCRASPDEMTARRNAQAGYGYLRQNAGVKITNTVNSSSLPTSMAAEQIQV